MSSPSERAPNDPRSGDVEYTSPLDSPAEVSVNGKDIIGGTPPMPTAAPSTALDGLAQALTPKRAVSYLRVSTRDQAARGGGDNEGFSIPAQRDANRHKAAAMGAIVIKEFVDRGASARSANRPELQAMLEYLGDHDVDFVIVHKLDRLARSRVDDVAISQALGASNVRLVSTTESIDESPSGMLLHGIMSSIAEFYSRNLAAEVVKGMTQKARSGGTNGRAPIGYRNFPTVDAEGRELRTVIIDAERAPLVKRAFSEYATGAWTIADLSEHLATLGLTTVPTPRRPSKPMTESLLHKVLTNPYYKGFVRFQTVYYPGRHEALIDESTWNLVQNVLATHVNGERTRRHPHYLKSSLYCGQCKERMIVTVARSASGERYPYFVCAGRHAKRTACTQRAVLIADVEKAIVEHYRTASMPHASRIDLEAALRAEMRSMRTQTEDALQRAQAERAKFERQQEKLMQAHYDGAIPLDLLAKEQDRISKALTRINSVVRASAVEAEDLERTLSQALDLAENCGVAYQNAPDHIRRQINQALYERLEIHSDLERSGEPLVSASPRPPFDTLLGASAAGRTPRASGTLGQAATEPAGNKKAVGSSRSLTAFHHVEGLNTKPMVGVTGFEPATSSSRTTRATKLRHTPN